MNFKRCLYFQETDNSVPGALQGTEKSSIEQPFMIERIHHCPIEVAMARRADCVELPERRAKVKKLGGFIF